MDFLDKRRGDRSHGRHVGLAMVPLPLRVRLKADTTHVASGFSRTRSVASGFSRTIIALAVLLAGCSSAPSSPESADAQGIRKVEAQVRGIT
jgi:hypothetical protein